jgi:branched-chain amino acid aminotransferase
MIYLNGTIVEEQDARLAPDDRGLLLGDGLFETLRAYDGIPFLLRKHLERLRVGCDLLSLPYPQSEDFDEIIRELLTLNHLRDAAIRLTLTRGAGPRGVLPPDDPAPTLMLTCTPLPANTPTSAFFSGWPVNEHSPLRAIKSLNYLEHILARQHAVRAGYDEALLVNTQGHLAGASAANVFAVLDGALHTPRLADGALPGVTRGVVIELAQAAGIATHERKILPQEFSEAQEAFLTNSLIGVQPLLRVGEWFSAGEAGPVTQPLQAAYRREVNAALANARRDTR